MRKDPKINREQLTNFRRISGEKRLHDKIIEADRLAVHAEFWRHSSWAVVLVHGWFQSLTLQNVRLLRELSYESDIVIVAPYWDTTIDVRSELLASFPFVDYVILSKYGNLLDLETLISPSKIVHESEAMLGKM